MNNKYSKFGLPIMQFLYETENSYLLKFLHQNVNESINEFKVNVNVPLMGNLIGIDTYKFRDLINLGIHSLNIKFDINKKFVIFIEDLSFSFSGLYDLLEFTFIPREYIKQNFGPNSNTYPYIISEEYKPKGYVGMEDSNKQYNFYHLNTDSIVLKINNFIGVENEIIRNSINCQIIGHGKIIDIDNNHYCLASLEQKYSENVLNIIMNKGLIYVNDSISKHLYIP